MDLSEEVLGLANLQLIDTYTVERYSAIGLTFEQTVGRRGCYASYVCHLDNTKGLPKKNEYEEGGIYCSAYPIYLLSDP